MVKKYEYEEFLNMVKKEMEFQKKALSPIKDEIVDNMFCLLSPYPSSFFIDNAVEIDKKYSMYLWDKNFDQIKNLFPDLEMDLIMDYVKYVRTKFIYDELERVKSRSPEDECTFFVYADSGESFVFEEPSYSCSTSGCKDHRYHVQHQRDQFRVRDRGIQGSSTGVWL